MELRLSSSAENSDVFEWTTGIFIAESEFSRETGARFRSVNGSPATGRASLPPLTRSSESSAFFVDVSYMANNQWTLGVGSRLFKDKRTLLNESDGIPLEDTFNNVSSKFYLSYAASEDANIYLSVSEGFRSGGFNNAATVLAGGALSYDPENVLSYELGFKSSWLTNNSLNIEAAIFYSDYKDFQGNYFDPLLLRGVNVNIGEAVVNGVEWDVRWAISQNFVLGFNGNVLFEAEYTELDPNVTVAEVGDTLNGVPDYNYSITADYRFNWSKSTPGFARFDHSVQGAE